MKTITIALLFSLSACAGLTQGAQKGPQNPSIVYNVHTTAGDSSPVTVHVGNAIQDVSEQGATDQTADNRPNISPTISPSVSGL